MTVLVATQSEVLVVDEERAEMRPARGMDGQPPTCLAADPWTADIAWCGTHRGGVYLSEDAGASWRPVGLRERHLMAITASPTEEGVVWAGTEPSSVWRSGDGGMTWTETRGLQQLPSAPTWSFPPRPETHHVRWIACHPRVPGKLWVAIEAGALVSTVDGGESWQDRAPDGPWDTHELAVHPEAPDTLRVSAGDGYFESFDGGESWNSPSDGLEVGYLRSVAIDPGDADTVLVSAASHPYSAYGAGRSDGRIYRRVGRGPFGRVVDGWPDPPDTIAPLLLAGDRAGQFWAADERGVHRSDDAGVTWRMVAAYPTAPRNLRGLVIRDARR